MLNVIINLVVALVVVSVPASWIISGIIGTIGYLVLNARWTDVKAKDYLSKEQLHGLLCCLLGGCFTFWRLINDSCDPTVADLEPIKKYGYFIL